MRLSGLGSIAPVLLLCVGLSCSSDTVTGPGGPVAGTTYTRELTSVSGDRIPAVYYSDPVAGYRYWADSATATVQADGVLAFHLYESATSPLGALHENQPSDTYFASGVLTSDSTFVIYYNDSSAPDRGTIGADGSITVDFTGTDGSGNSLPFGTWVFASQYRGPKLNPAPRITGLDPATILAGNADVTLTINGSGFTGGSVISLDDQPLQSVLVSSTELQVDLSRAFVSIPNTFELLVKNPGPGGGTYYYPLSISRVAPTIAALSPSTVAAGSEIYTVAITGTGFDAGTMVMVNGVPREAARLVSPTSLHVGLDPSELAVPGVIQIAVMNPPPGGGTSSSLPFTVTAAERQLTSEIIAPVSANVLAGDPVRSVVYAGVDGFDPAHPNSVIALDATTGNVLWSVPSHGKPTMLAVSDDGQFLYYAAEGDSVMHRITLATATVDLTIPIYVGPQCSPAVAYGAVLPGSPHALAVEHYCLVPMLGRGHVVTIYDDSIARPKVASDPNGTALGPITFGASAAVLYTYSPGQAYDVTIDASGATASLPHSVVGPSLNSEIAYLNGIVYSPDGALYDPATHGSAVQSPWFPSTAYSIAPGRDGKTMYAITDRMTLDVLDVSQGTLLGSVSVPGPDSPSRNLVRWGADGVAFISASSYQGGTVYLVRSDLVH